MNYAKKSLGQNYLIDLNIIKKIIHLTEVHNKNILEIGPGKGALTKELAKMHINIYAVEIDPMLCKSLKNESLKNVKIW